MVCLRGRKDPGLARLGGEQREGEERIDGRSAAVVGCHL